MKRVVNFSVLLLVAHFVGGVLFAQNYKIKQVTNIAGQKLESTIYVKNPRKRTESGSMMGMGGDVASIEQCDLKRNVKISDKKKSYFITPFASESTEEPVSKSRTAPPPTRVKKGGTVTISTALNDTGERKQMFGLTARRIKSSIKVVSSPDACSQSNTSMEIDGWYVDLPQFSCPVNLRDAIPYQPQRGGCQDRTIIKNTGGGRLGFPLSLTQTIDSGDGRDFTQTIETIEFSKATLADSLFDIPADYTLAKQESDLYGRPDIAAMMKAAQADGESTEFPQPGTASTVTAKKPGVKRVGVLAPAGTFDSSLSATELQRILVSKLTANGVDAIPISSEADAKSGSCDLILTSQFSKFKQSAASKIGGLFGKITDTDTSSTRSWEMQVDYNLAAVSDGKNILKNKASLKSGGEARQAAEAVLALEVTAVAGKVQ